MEKRLVHRGDEIIELTFIEFGLLKVLAQSPGGVYSRMQLLDMIQGEDTSVLVMVFNLLQERGGSGRKSG